MKKRYMLFVGGICLILFCANIHNSSGSNIHSKSAQESYYVKTELLNQAKRYIEKVPAKDRSCLPSSLQFIDEEAFDGTNLTSIEIPNSVITIGDYAFANIMSLTRIDIPNGVEYIGKDTFQGSKQVTISCAPYGYIRDWAYKNGVPYKPITSLYTCSLLVQVLQMDNKAKECKLILANNAADHIHARQTGRMQGELNVSYYKGYSAFCVQGRAPPKM